MIPTSTKSKSSKGEILKTQNIYWFSPSHQHLVEQTMLTLKSAGSTQISVGINCNDACTKKGNFWYSWLIPTLGQQFKLKLVFDNYSKSEIGLDDADLKKPLAEIVECFVHYHGQYFDEVELYKSPDHQIQTLIEANNIFSDELIFAATWAKYLGKKVSLGNVHLSDYEWVSKLTNCQIVDTVDTSEHKIDTSSRLIN